MSYFVQLPDPTQAAVVALVVAVFGIALRYVTLYVPWLGEFLEKYKEEWGTALGVILVNLLQQYLPGGEWAGASILSVELVVVVVGVLLTKLVFNKLGVRKFK